MNLFKATIRTLKDLSWEDFRNLFTWPGTRNIQTENPNLLIAKATNSRGEVVGYVTAEPIVVIDNYIVNPQSTDDFQLAGNVLDSALAQIAGATRMWLVVPDDVEETIKGEKYIRVVERRVYQPTATTQKQFGRCEVKQQAAYLN